MASFFEKLKKGMDIKKVPDEEETKQEDLSAEEEKELVETEAEEPEKEESELESEPEAEEKPENLESDIPQSLPAEEITPEELSEKLENKPDPNGSNAQTASIKSFVGDIFKEEESGKKKAKHGKLKTKIGAERKKPLQKLELKGDSWLEQDGELVVDVYETDSEIVVKSAIAGVKPEDLDISVENDTVTIKGKREETREERNVNYIRKECFWGSFYKEIILPEEVNGGKADATMKNGILTIRVPKIVRQKKKISIR